MTHLQVEDLPILNDMMLGKCRIKKIIILVLVVFVRKCSFSSHSVFSFRMTNIDILTVVWRLEQSLKRTTDQDSAAKSSSNNFTFRKLQVSISFLLADHLVDY